MSTALATTNQTIDIPTIISSEQDLAKMVSDTAIRVLSYVENTDDPEETSRIREQWEVFLVMVDGKRRRASARAQTVARLIEMRIGDLLPAPGEGCPEYMSEYEYKIAYTFARWRNVVEGVIAGSTNQHPPSRNACLQAIRVHRIETGDLPAPKQRKKTDSTARVSMLTRLNEARIAYRDGLESNPQTVAIDRVYTDLRKLLLLVDKLAIDRPLQSKLHNVLTQAESVVHDLIIAEHAANNETE